MASGQGYTRCSSVTDAYNINIVPTTLLITQDGVIEFNRIGVIDARTLQENINYVSDTTITNGRESPPESSTETAFIPSFGISEILIALFTLMGLESWWKRRKA